jgi:hypothetical protein
VKRGQRLEAEVKRSLRKPGMQETRKKKRTGISAEARREGEDEGTGRTCRAAGREE